MTANGSDPAGALAKGELRLNRLLGRKVRAKNGESIGRIEEFRTDKHGSGWVIREYVIGPAGLLERVGIGVGLLFGRQGGGHVAEWHQVDISDPDRPRLTCSTAELRRL
jgi:hypothetical protein